LHAKDLARAHGEDHYSHNSSSPFSRERSSDHLVCIPKLAEISQPAYYLAVELIKKTHLDDPENCSGLLGPSSFSSCHSMSESTKDWGPLNPLESKGTNKLRPSLVKNYHSASLFPFQFRSD
ncbi:hypothetical protein N9054_01745, partial [bacterium]|nr:hypothetical protein [bacterium]